MSDAICHWCIVELSGPLPVRFVVRYLARLYPTCADHVVQLRRVDQTYQTRARVLPLEVGIPLWIVQEVLHA